MAGITLKFRRFGGLAKLVANEKEEPRPEEDDTPDCGRSARMASPSVLRPRDLVEKPNAGTGTIYWRITTGGLTIVDYGSIAEQEFLDGLYAWAEAANAADAAMQAQQQAAQQQQNKPTVSVTTDLYKNQALNRGYSGAQIQLTATVTGDSSVAYNWQQSVTTSNIPRI